MCSYIINFFRSRVLFCSLLSVLNPSLPLLTLSPSFPTPYSSLPHPFLSPCSFYFYLLPNDILLFLSIICQHLSHFSKSSLFIFRYLGALEILVISNYCSSPSCIYLDLPLAYRILKKHEHILITK